MDTTRSTHSSRIALITGGSRGLGKSMALHLADRGAGVVITYRTGEREAHEVVAAIETNGGHAAALRLDVGDAKSFAPFADSLKETLRRVFQKDRVDYLVNNAGVGIHAAFAETTEAQFDELVSVHLKSTFFLTQKLLPLIADGGRILNVSTGLARFSLPGYSAYAAVKGAVEVLSRYMAKELGPRNISVNVLAPGAIETDFGGAALRNNPEIKKFVASVTALGRAGQAEDIGTVVSALLSPETAWMTGQRIEVSGGMFL